MSTARIALSCPAYALFAALVPLAFAACSSTTHGSATTTESTPTAPADGGVPPATDASKPAVSPPKKDAAPVDPPPAGECSSEATQTSCITCCSNKHQDGSGVYFVALIDCMCLADNCAKDCAKTLCDPSNPQNADATCQSCVQAKNSACAPTVMSTCQADADCVAFDACIGKSNCSDK